MPKQPIYNCEPQVLLSRPQRNTKAKVVFDPSDNHIPKKKRTKLSENLSANNLKPPVKTPVKLSENLSANNLKPPVKAPVKLSENLSANNLKPPVKAPVKLSENLSANNLKPPVKAVGIFKKNSKNNNVNKSIETSIAKKIVTNNTENNRFVQSTSKTVNGFNKDKKDEYVDDNLVSMDIPDSEVICSICYKFIKTDKDLVDCRICLIGFHRDCLIVKEPMWKWKLDDCIFLCQICRLKRCSKCSLVKYNFKTFIRCSNCEVGLHLKCYEEYDIKPMYTAKPDKYLCIPCVTLTVERVPEVEGNEELSNPSIITITDSADSEDDIKSDISFGSSSIKSLNNDENFSQSNEDKNDIPNIAGWNKERLFNYFSRYLPEEVAIKILREDLDGDLLLLFKRKDLIRLKLSCGKAMKFYKLVRILQERSAKDFLFWE